MSSSIYISINIVQAQGNWCSESIPNWFVYIKFVICRQRCENIQIKKNKYRYNCFIALPSVWKAYAQFSFLHYILYFVIRAPVCILCLWLNRLTECSHWPKVVIYFRKADLGLLSKSARWKIQTSPSARLRKYICHWLWDGPGASIKEHRGWFLIGHVL